MVIRGETELDATLGDLLNVPDPAGAATLRSLASHTSGLPRLAPSPRLKVRALTAHPDPYRGIDLAHVIAAMTRNPPGPAGGFPLFQPRLPAARRGAGRCGRDDLA